MSYTNLSTLARSATLMLLLVVMGNAFAQEVPVESDTESIFDGKTLDGWNGDPRLWTIKDGAIRGETTDQLKANGNTFIIWEGGELSDFELRLEFRCSATNNSGIQYRSKHIKDGKVKNDWVVRGYQHEIRNENELPSVSGFIYGEGIGRGRMCLVGEKAVWDDDGKQVTGKLIDADGFKELFHLDDWNEVIIVGKGRRLQHYMNGKLILDFTDNSDKALDSGILALQLHAGRPMWAEYRNIRLKHLK